ncbi:MAG: hypothetical protein JWO84_511 [Parcubacteria group bacterium]|nr:hypothetical protein [Parcubacteria group bacterium]
MTPALSADERTQKFTKMLSKVPEVTFYFWMIKVLCTTVGETAADYLATTLNFGLTVTTLITAGLLAIVLFVQFRARRYVPGIYWLAVVLISVVGTQITDNLVDNFGVPLEVTTIIFALILAGVFFWWYRVERTLSIHSILTTRREAFYWLAILFTFALGTSAGDLAAESLNLGYLVSALIFAALIGVTATFHYAGKAMNASKHLAESANTVAAFWIAYILTRPLGASIGDYLSQAPADGGLGLGTTLTSIVFLAAILALVVYLTVTKRDTIRTPR